jgi:hypothetical protein
MTKRDILTFASGALGTAIVAWSAAEIRAQSILLNPETAIHACVAADASLHMIELSAECPSGQKSLYLKKAQADVDYKDDSDKAKTKDSTCGDRQLSAADRQKIGDLERRVSELENLSNRGQLGNRVTAPFEVVGASGKRIFYVEDGNVGFYNDGGKEVAAVVMTPTSGNFVGRSSSGNFRVTVGAGETDAGLSIRENDVDRFGIHNRQGSYVALFYNDKGQRVAGIGQSQAGKGAAYVADSAGNVRAEMRMNEEDKPIISVLNKDIQLATLSQGVSLGGKLTLWGAAGGAPMVEAGSTAEGIGVVRTGPEGFKPGMGVLGLPSSYISGKQ